MRRDRGGVGWIVGATACAVLLALGVLLAAGCGGATEQAREEGVGALPQDDVDAGAEEAEMDAESMGEEMDVMEGAEYPEYGTEDVGGYGGGPDEDTGGYGGGDDGGEG